MKYFNFKERYIEAKSWGDGEKLLNELSSTELKKFIDTHQAVKDTTGLDMRQEWYLTVAKSTLEGQKK